MGEPARAPFAARLLVSLLAGAVLVGALVAQWSPAFTSYDSDLWAYLLVVERVADGQDLAKNEPFRLEPPPSPQVSAAWLGLGHLRRWSALPPLALARGLGLVSIALLCASAWILAGRLLGKGFPQVLALLLFWVSLPETWAAVVLGRYLSLAFVALAAAAALDLGKSRGAPVKAALFVALAFYAHLFGGVLAASAVLIVLFARWRRGEDPGWRPSALLVALSTLFAAPCLAFALRAAGFARTTAHTWRPEQAEAFGLTWMRPGHILELLPLVALGLALVGLVVPCPPERRLAQEVCRVGTILTALVWLTPLYQLAAELYGAWMVGRLAILAFPWLSAALAIEWLQGGDPSRLRRTAAMAVIIATTCEGGVRAARDWSSQADAYAFAPAARAEATALRGTLRGRSFIAPDLMGYGLAAPTLGRPLAVPPGHVSPFGDFRRQQRRVHRAFSANTAECWAALIALYPDTEFLLTPAAGAAVERRIWRERFPESEPEAVRDRLRSLGVLTPVHVGSTFVLDALAPARVTEGQGSRGGGMGVGPRCREER